MVERISLTGLNKILDGQTIGVRTCVVKFYSNNCDYCHNLQGYFKDISEIKNYENMHFFAFNIADGPRITKRLKLSGVPTICLIKTKPPKSQIIILDEPEQPHEHTWYRSKEIQDFIERNT
jgi:hypothetical protein